MNFKPFHLTNTLQTVQKPVAALQLQTIPEYFIRTNVQLKKQSISTKLGDTGKTNLLYGGRVRKSTVRVEAYGCGDEAISALGFARALSKNKWIKEKIFNIQKEMFIVNTELASDPKHLVTLKKHFPVVTREMTKNIETLLDQLESKLTLPKSFVIPGGSPASAALDLARTAIRKTERRFVELTNDENCKGSEIGPYLNRLSDYVFMLARYEDRDLPYEALTGESGK